MSQTQSPLAGLSNSDFDELDFLRRSGSAALAELFTKYQPQLQRMVSFRLDQRLYGRVDPTDVLQEAFVEISRRIHEFVTDPKTSFFVWARQITWQTLLTIHRLNLEVQKRDAGRELPLHWSAHSEATSVSLSSKLAGDATSPSQALMRDERAALLRQSLDAMDPIDREVLALRHFEHLTNNEVAEVLGIQKQAASNRYVRALERLRIIMIEVMPDGQ
ncbi:MAG: sigma-70 family RNA polymerase sigma factor [Pirellulaceae bacterium]|nr:sigma-70 family RNA polymerase sigma factor [Pirellulaceae bacterium]